MSAASSSPEFNDERPLILSNAEVEGDLVDVIILNGIVDTLVPSAGSLAPGLLGDAHRIDVEGSALLPGLHDHHVHLLSWAASLHSLNLATSPVQPNQLAATISDADRSLGQEEWLRVTGYHESMGLLDRKILDEMNLQHPTRVQHRSGAQWILNSLACDIVGLDHDHDGQLLGADDWLHQQLPPHPLDLEHVTHQLHQCGVTGVSDLTPTSSLDQFAPLLAFAQTMPSLDIRVSSDPWLACDPGTLTPLVLGPVKVYIADHTLPELDQVVAAFSAARSQQRAIAVHSVTEISLALAVAAWNQVGALPGDRLEHGSLISDAAASELARLGVGVITQPNFIVDRGEQYKNDLDESDLEILYRCASLEHLGVSVSFGTDAPFGTPDPWWAMAASTTRVTKNGSLLGAHERLRRHDALSKFLTPLDDPFGQVRRVQPGVRANLCLLDRPLRTIGDDLSKDLVAMTFFEGSLVYSA